MSLQRARRERESLAEQLDAAERVSVELRQTASRAASATTLEVQYTACSTLLWLMCFHYRGSAQSAVKATADAAVRRVQNEAAFLKTQLDSEVLQAEFARCIATNVRAPCRCGARVN